MPRPRPRPRGLCSDARRIFARAPACRKAWLRRRLFCGLMLLGATMEGGGRGDVHFRAPGWEKGPKSPGDRARQGEALWIAASCPPRHPAGQGKRRAKANAGAGALVSRAQGLSPKARGDEGGECAKCRLRNVKARRRLRGVSRLKTARGRAAASRRTARTR